MAEIIFLMNTKNASSAHPLCRSFPKCRVCDHLLQFCVTCDHVVCINSHLQNRVKEKYSCEKHVYIPTWKEIFYKKVRDFFKGSKKDYYPIKMS
jgi:hypothetical protein